MLTAAEYDRRRQFVDTIKTLGKAELIEIARILQRNGVTLSENRSGIYFDMAQLSQKVFDDLLAFHQFVLQNNKELEKRGTGAKAVGH